MGRSILLILQFILIPCAVWAQDNARTVVLVSNLDAVGIDQPDSEIFSEYLRGQLSRDCASYRFIEATNHDGSCLTDKCVLQSGKLAGARKMVTGSVTKAGDDYLLDLRVLDIETGQIENKVSEKCAKCSDGKFFSTIETAARKILPVAGAAEVALKSQTKATVPGAVKALAVASVAIPVLSIAQASAVAGSAIAAPILATAAVIPTATVPTTLDASQTIASAQSAATPSMPTKSVVPPTPVVPAATIPVIPAIATAVVAVIPAISAQSAVQSPSASTSVAPIKNAAPVPVVSIPATVAQTVSTPAVPVKDVAQGGTTPAVPTVAQSPVIPKTATKQPAQTQPVAKPVKSAVNGDSKTPRWEVSLGGGSAMPINGAWCGYVNTSSDIDVSAGYKLTKHSSVGIDFAYDNEFNSNGNGMNGSMPADMKFSMYNVGPYIKSGMPMLGISDRVSIYGVAGAGIYRWDSNDLYNSSGKLWMPAMTGTRFGINFGEGLEYAVTPRLGLAFELRWHHIFSMVTDSQLGEGMGFSANNIVQTFRLNYSF